MSKLSTHHTPHTPEIGSSSSHPSSLLFAVDCECRKKAVSMKESLPELLGRIDPQSASPDSDSDSNSSDEFIALMNIILQSNNSRLQGVSLSSVKVLSDNARTHFRSIRNMTDDEWTDDLSVCLEDVLEERSRSSILTTTKSKSSSSMFFGQDCEQDEDQQGEVLLFDESTTTAQSSTSKLALGSACRSLGGFLDSPVRPPARSLSVFLTSPVPCSPLQQSRSPPRRSKLSVFLESPVRSKLGTIGEAKKAGDAPRSFPRPFLSI